MQTLLVILAFVALVASREWWLPPVRRIFKSGFFWTFLAVLFLALLGGLIWYWWQQPSDTFYGSKWEDITIEDQTGALVIRPAKTPVQIDHLERPVPDGAPVRQPAPAPQVASSRPTIVEVYTGADVLSDVPFWRHPAVAPQIVVPGVSVQQAIAASGLLEVSVIANGKALVLTSDYLSKTPEGDLVVSLDPPDTFRPGKYRLEVRSAVQGQTAGQSVLLYQQDFTWGVLAFDPDSDVYAPGETATIQFGVLNDEGVTICTADLTVRVTAPSGKSETISTINGRIKRNPACKDKEVTNIPDYSGTVVLSERGTYAFTITADTPNGLRTAIERVEVSARDLPDITRNSMARIYPPAAYPMDITFRPSHTFQGRISDKLPPGFTVSGTTPPAAVTTDPVTGEVFITWTGSFEKGKTYPLRYTYDAPDVSPALHLVGPIEIDGQLVEDSATTR